jgi:hypothetical protein
MKSPIAVLMETARPRNAKPCLDFPLRKTFGEFSRPIAKSNANTNKKRKKEIANKS